MKYSYSFLLGVDGVMVCFGDCDKNGSNVLINENCICYGGFGLQKYVFHHRKADCGVKLGCSVVEIDFCGGKLVEIRTNRKISEVRFVDLRSETKSVKNPPTNADFEQAAMAAREDWNAVVDKEDWTMVVA